MRFDVHWRKVSDVFDGFSMDSRVKFNSTERKKKEQKSVTATRKDWLRQEEKKVTREDKQKGKVIHGINIYESVLECSRKC